MKPSKYKTKDSLKQFTCAEPHKQALIQEETPDFYGLQKGLKTTKMLNMELDQLHQALMASKKAEKELKESLAEVQKNLASSRETNSVSCQIVSDAHGKIKELHEKVKQIEKLEADKCVATETYHGVKVLLQSQLTEAHMKLHDTQGEIKLYQLQLERKIATAEEQELEGEDQMKRLQKKHDELEIEVSSAKAEQLNVQMLLQAALVTASEREHEACEHVKSLQAQLQKKTAAAEQQEREGSARIELLNQENQNLRADRINLMHHDSYARSSLEGDISIAKEGCVQAQQQIALVDARLQDQIVATSTKELELHEQLSALQRKLTAHEERLTSWRVSAQVREEDLSRELATAQECQHKSSAVNQELRGQLLSAQQLSAQLQEDLNAAQSRTARALSSKVFVLFINMASCICPSMIRLQS